MTNYPTRPPLTAAEELALAKEAALAALVALQPSDNDTHEEPRRWADPRRRVRHSPRGSWANRA
ncbi:hypothetical protein JOE56_000500 [Brevibacterium paucivorans]|uniref:Acyl-CoA carboxylase subunit epsilon n=1 Tax=Brevibacterium paucivorans TaxID=170994 RepID=A0ABS2SHT6_9MICO|nr:hypothetical protein [Brevibacterium paucivorans]MBM7815806.1 hypothetical protein [Brevibacterium paucivorans]